MTSIYTTKDSLESICLEKQKEPWLEIIYKLKEVFIDETNIFEGDVPPEDDPLLILDQMQIDIISREAEYINSIENNPASVLRHPNGIFLLNISATKAASIEKDFGVICQSVSKLDYSPLAQRHVPTELIKDEPNHSWGKMIAQFKRLPSNSVLIVDAHLFNQDYYDYKKGCYDSNRRVGMNNLRDILDCILPKYFRDIYHIGLFVTDIETAKAGNRSHSNLTKDIIVSEVSKVVNDLKRKYRINLEVLFFDHQDQSGHELIHNRRIMSNYFCVTAEYKLATLSDGKSLCTQSISTFPLFECIDIDKGSDKKEKRIRHELEEFQNFINRQCQIPKPTAVLYQNGKVQPNCMNFLLRLLK